MKSVKILDKICQIILKSVHLVYCSFLYRISYFFLLSTRSNSGRLLTKWPAFAKFDDNEPPSRIETLRLMLMLEATELARSLPLAALSALSPIPAEAHYYLNLASSGSDTLSLEADGYHSSVNCSISTSSCLAKFNAGTGMPGGGATVSRSPRCSDGPSSCPGCTLFSPLPNFCPSPAGRIRSNSSSKFLVC